MKLNKWYVISIPDYPDAFIPTEIVWEGTFNWHVSGYVWYNFKQNTLDFAFITNFSIFKLGFDRTFIPLEQHR